MLKKLLPNALITPIIVGSFDDTIVSAISAVVGQPDTILLCSSDFCHWGADFDYYHHFEDRGLSITDSIKELDYQAI